MGKGVGRRVAGAPSAFVQDESPDESSRDELSRDVRHDLRHWASAILMLVATLREHERDAVALSACDGITHCARRIAALVNDLDEQPGPQPVDVGSLATQASGRATLLYPGTVSVRVEPALVNAPEIDIARLLANLIQNACRAAGPDGTVHLGVGNEDPWCVIRIGDSGAGFVEKPSSDGIGLSVVAGIAVRLEGYVTFGRSPLGGALVTVHLPLFEAPLRAREHADVNGERS